MYIYTPDELVKAPAHFPEYTADWRWQRAEQIALQYSQIPESIEEADSFLAEAARFRRALRESQRIQKDWTELKARFGDLFTAFETRFTPTYSENRWILEAFLLVETEPKEIARLSGIPVGVATRFEKLFYDVKFILRSRAMSYVLLIDPLLRDPDRDRREVQLKLIAKVGGRSMLAEAIRPHPQFTPEQRELALKTLRIMARHRLFQQGVDYAVGSRLMGP